VAYNYYCKRIKDVLQRVTGKAGMSWLGFNTFPALFYAKINIKEVLS
jgi:hypothetical protein